MLIAQNQSAEESSSPFSSGRPKITRKCVQLGGDKSIITADESEICINKTFKGESFKFRFGTSEDLLLTLGMRNGHSLTTTCPEAERQTRESTKRVICSSMTNIG